MLTELSLAQLNVAYNRAVAELKLPLKEIKGFHDKPTGVARLTKIMAEHDLVLDGTKLVRNGLAGLNADMAGLAAHGVEAPVAGTGNGLEGLADSLSGNVVKFKAVTTKKAAKGVAKGAAGLVASFKKAMANAKPEKAAKPAKVVKAEKAAKAAKPVKAAKAAKASAHRGPKAEYGDAQVISLLVANPKRKGSLAFKRYANYVDGMTVREALDAGLTREDFRWDTRHGHISIK
jgi:hypothetical protein